MADDDIIPETDIRETREMTRRIIEAESRLIDAELQEIAAEIERQRKLLPPTSEEIAALIEIDKQNARRGIRDSSHWEERGL